MQAQGYIKGKPVVLELAPIPGGLYMREDAAHAFIGMSQKAAGAGITLRANTAYRSHEYQTQLYTRYQADFKTYLKALAAWSQTGTNKPNKPAPVAQPGYSNHEGGVAVDINRAPGDNPATPAPDSPIDLWLNAHAKTYGFHRDVPSEPWHWTFDPTLLSV